MLKDRSTRHGADGPVAQPQAGASLGANRLVPTPGPFRKREGEEAYCRVPVIGMSPKSLWVWPVSVLPSAVTL